MLTTGSRDIAARICSLPFGAVMQYERGNEPSKVPPPRTLTRHRTGITREPMTTHTGGRTAVRIPSDSHSPFAHRSGPRQRARLSPHDHSTTRTGAWPSRQHALRCFRGLVGRHCMRWAVRPPREGTGAAGTVATLLLWRLEPPPRRASVVASERRKSGATIGQLPSLESSRGPSRRRMR